MHAGCMVPAQRNPSDPSVNDIIKVSIPNGDHALFPFYTQAAVDPSKGESCASVRVLGECSCNGGVADPDCYPEESSTWLHAKDADFRFLPRGLSHTCVEAKPDARDANNDDASDASSMTETGAPDKGGIISVGPVLGARAASAGLEANIQHASKFFCLKIPGC